MVDIRRILCPVDFSDHSRRALDHAIAIARCYKATVTALYVFSPAPAATIGPGPMTIDPIILTPADRDQLQGELKAFVNNESAPGIAIDAVVREGDTVDEILQQQTSMKTDLLIIGTHGRSGFERLVLGSVTEKVLRKAECPVMTVPRSLPDAVPIGPVLYRRILCPIDFSESSRRALRYAASLAQEGGGALTMLHVVAHEVEFSAGTGYDESMTIGMAMRERDQTLQQRMDRAASEVTASCPVQRVLTYGKPWREVLRVADERQHDLIVMGVQGRGAADLLFFGSTTQHVVRQATCPVMTLRQR